jgi:uncharacterized membrane protein YtjA (UPF0391 family)
MLWWSLIFFMVAVAAAIFGFGGIVTGATTIPQILFVIFIIGFLITLVMGLIRQRI